MDVNVHVETKHDVTLGVIYLSKQDGSDEDNRTFCRVADLATDIHKESDESESCMTKGPERLDDDVSRQRSIFDTILHPLLAVYILKTQDYRPLVHPGTTSQVLESR